MDEKVLIKSKINKKAKSKFLGIVGLFFAAAGILFTYLLFSKPVKYSSKYETKYWDNGFDEAFNNASGGNQSQIIFIFAASLTFIGIVALLIYWVHSKCEISITEKNVKGKTLFGKEVVLPLYMVSAYSTRKFLSTISVATSSGITKFSFVSNYAEIGNILSQKINERQEGAGLNSSVNPSTPQNSSMDDLKKLKDLLDAGIITQEEFDAKKKQLLGL